MFAKNDSLLPKMTVCLPKMIFLQKFYFVQKKVGKNDHFLPKNIAKNDRLLPKQSFVCQKRSFVKNDRFLPKNIAGKFAKFALNFTRNNSWRACFEISFLEYKMRNYF